MTPLSDGQLTREPRVSACDIFTEAELASMQVDARREGRCASLNTSSGMPCRRRPRFGHALCPTHERRVPKSRDESERLLAFMRMPALEAIHTVIEQWSSETCAECGFPRAGDNETHRTMIAMAKLVLDRSGFGPSARLDVHTRTDVGIPLDRLSAGELEDLDRLLGAMEEFKARVNARLAGQALTIDAEVVEEKEPEPLALSVPDPVVSAGSPIDGSQPESK